MQAKVLDGHAEVGVHHAGLDRRPLVFSVDFNDPVHARKRNDDSAVTSECAARQTRSRASADQRNLVAIGEPDDFDHVRSGTREDHAIRSPDIDRTIVFVQQQVLGLVQYAARAEQACQLVEES